MSGQNMPILYQNIMYGLPSDFSRDVFLWAVDKFPFDHMAYKAEHFAREAEGTVKTFKALINIHQRVTLRDGGILMNEEQEADLLRFAQARYANYRLGGNIKTAMPELTHRKDTPKAKSPALN